MYTRSQQETADEVLELKDKIRKYLDSDDEQIELTEEDYNALNSFIEMNGYEYKRRF